MDKTDCLLKSVAETIYEEEGLFFVTVNADETDFPLEGLQRLVMGGKATPKLDIGEAGINVSLSINRIHHDVHIPWSAVSAVEGNYKAFFCKREVPENDTEGDKEKAGENIVKKAGHLKVVK